MPPTTVDRHRTVSPIRYSAVMPPVTAVLLVLTCLVSWLGFSNRSLIDRLILWPPAITRGRQVDRLLTHGFIHADLPHLAFNMITLYFFGSAVEPFFSSRTGPWGFAVFYLLGIVIAALPSWWRHRHDADYRSLGASGGVAAVLFSFILLAPWTTIYVLVLPVPAIVYGVLYTAYEIWMNRRGTDNINHSAHLAGALFGVLATLAIAPQAGPHFIRQLASVLP